MLIQNKSKNTTLVETATNANSFIKGMFGLIFYKKPIGMIFKTHFGIHTLFMQYPIDVLVLNKRNKVVTINPDLKPNKIYLWNPRYSKVVELPEGSIKKSKTEVGDFLEFV